MCIIVDPRRLPVCRIFVGSAMAGETFEDRFCRIARHYFIRSKFRSACKNGLFWTTYVERSLFGGKIQQFQLRRLAHW